MPAVHGAVWCGVRYGECGKGEGGGRARAGCRQVTAKAAAWKAKAGRMQRAGEKVRSSEEVAVRSASRTQQAAQRICGRAAGARRCLAGLCGEVYASKEPRTQWRASEAGE